MYEYKGFSYEIPAQMALKECLECHEMPMTVEEAEAVEEGLEFLKQFRVGGGILFQPLMKADLEWVPED